MVNNYFSHKNPRKGNNFFAYMQIKVRILIEISSFLANPYFDIPYKSIDYSIIVHQPCLSSVRPYWISCKAWYSLVSTGPGLSPKEYVI